MNRIIEIQRLSPNQEKSYLLLLDAFLRDGRTHKALGKLDEYLRR